MVRDSDAVAGFLKDAVPGFQAVVIPDPQSSEPNPALPDMDLKNVTLAQFLELLKHTLPQVDIDLVPGEKGDIWLFKVNAPAGTGGMGGGMGMGGMMSVPGVPGRHVASAAPAEAVGPRLEVYRLSPLIPAGADRTKSLNDILSLVQAALEAQGSANNALMKVHEATGTLIFRGNAAQIDVVQRALQALEPTSAESERAKLQEHMQTDRERMQVRVVQLDDRLKEAEAEAGAARKRISEQATEIEVLKARLAAQGDKKP